MDSLADGAGVQVIVVIDDDAPTRRVIGEILVDEGFEVVLWDGLSDPADFARAVNASTLIVDLHLGPRWTGWNVIEALQREAGTLRLPVIVCTADQRAIQEYGKTLEDLSCLLVPKPFDLVDLVNAVRQSVASVPGNA